METILSGCQIHHGQLVSLFLSTNAGQKLYLSRALWHNLPIVCNVGLHKQLVQCLQCADGNVIVGPHLWIPHRGGKMFANNSADTEKVRFNTPDNKA